MVGKVYAVAHHHLFIKAEFSHGGFQGDLVGLLLAQLPGLWQHLYHVAAVRRVQPGEAVFQGNFTALRPPLKGPFAHIAILIVQGVQLLFILRLPGHPAGLHVVKGILGLEGGQRRLGLVINIQGVQGNIARGVPRLNVVVMEALPQKGDLLPNFQGAPSVTGQPRVFKQGRFVRLDAAFEDRGFRLFIHQVTKGHIAGHLRLAIGVAQDHIRPFLLGVATHGGGDPGEGHSSARKQNHGGVITGVGIVIQMGGFLSPGLLVFVPRDFGPIARPLPEGSIPLADIDRSLVLRQNTHLQPLLAAASSRIQGHHPHATPDTGPFPPGYLGLDV